MGTIVCRSDEPAQQVGEKVSCTTEHFSCINLPKTARPTVDDGARGAAPNSAPERIGFFVSVAVAVAVGAAAAC